MRAQVYIIAILSCLIFWSVFFFTSRDVYRAAHVAGVIPNLHIQDTIRSIF